MDGISVQLRMCSRVLVLLAVAHFGLQAPTPRSVQEGGTSCPGYRSGNAARRNMAGCETGTHLGVVDHETAFRFNLSHTPDWRSCILPDHELPVANHRVCFRTNVDKCGSEYRIFLRRRNFPNLIRSCPGESEALRVYGSEYETLELQSPRYGCMKKRSNNPYAYRKSELCFYNVSISKCESNILNLKKHSRAIQELEARDDNGVCKDYLQFYYGSTKTEAYCGNELMMSQGLEIPAADFMAVFWTDPGDNRLGFKLDVTCKQLTTNT